MKLEFSRQIFENSSNIKFHETPSIGSRVVPRGRTDRRTDMKKLIVAFRNFANAPKNEGMHSCLQAVRTLDLCLSQIQHITILSPRSLSWISFFLMFKYSPYISSSHAASIIWCLFDLSSLIWNNVGDQLDATMMIYWYSTSSTCFRQFFAHFQER
jgi:hypothetical protein